MAILHKAFIGELTAKWRKENNIDLSSWQEKTIDELCTSLKYGTSKKSKPEGSVVVLRMGNLQNGEIDWSNLMYTDDKDDIEKYLLKKGDVLFNRTNSPELVGKTSIYRGEYPAIYAGYLIKLDYGKDIIGEYLNYMMNSTKAKHYCYTVKTDGVSQSNINAKKIGAFEIPVPTIEEQQEIVNILDNLLAKYNKIKNLEQQLEKIELLKYDVLKERMYRLIQILNREVQLANIKQNIQIRTREDIDRQQREYFLQQQIKNIQDELGGGQEDEIDELRQKGQSKKWGKEVAALFEKELSKLERINSQSPDFNVQLTYLQTLLALPWESYTTDNLNIGNAEKTLNKDHYGLEKVKERILEHLAVLKLRGNMKSPIICLYGPPGVGKTSLGRSIASALKRKYVRMSLGGVHDEAEIRGHRKTYIGAMPGRIIKSLIKAESSNPVIILDEIDKLGSDHRGDPSSAMLEVLDPEQNNTFHDNYLDVDYDLSKVMFIATANNLSTIPPALLDRMELIEVSGYITEEKVEIARRHLVPKELEANGIKKEYVKFSKAALECIVENYTRESGVRELEKKINKVMRKIALEFARDGYEVMHEIKPADVRKYLGTPEYSRDKYQGNEYAGVVTGLAWTAVGGEILFVETSLSKGKGGKLTLTGNLGDVMKESAMLALEYLKAHTKLLNLQEDIFDNWNIHIHVPEGAIPKDGPSAGITMVTSLASALTQRKVKANLAMTGEITLRGKVLPVGGIKEKILAAKRAGIKDIILCEENRKNIEEIQPMYLEGLTFHYVTDIKEVLALALTNEKVNGAIDFNITNQKTEEKK